MAAGSQIQRSYFDVLGICCPSEVPLVQNIVNSLPGVKECSVIVTTRTVIVLHDALLVSQVQIVKALNQARLEANVRVDASSSDHKKKWPSPYAMGSGVLFVVSLFGYLYHPLRWVALGAVAVGIIPLLLKGLASLRKLRLDITVLALIAVIGTVVLKDYIEAATIVFLFSIAEWLEARASHKAQAVMSSLMSIAPQKAVIAETEEEVNVDEVKVNTLLAVKPGEVIPIDGIVVNGKCEVDEKTLTGESFPVTKEIGSTVYAGTINIDGYIHVKTTVLAEDCVVANMTKLVEEAQNTKTRTQRFIDEFAQYYTPAVIVLSAGVAVVPLALKVHNRNHWYHLALVVLLSACPCALILSTPVATFCALTKAATAGMLIKGGEYLETLGKAKIMAFDKTGTLTRGEFIVNDFESLSQDFSRETLLYWVASIESKSSHPMATALVDYARFLSVEPKPENVEDFQNFPGEGIYGKIDGKQVYIGNKKIASRAESETVPTAELKKGGTIGYMYCDKKAVAAFSLSDMCRTGVKDALTELKKLKVITAMLTGDSLSSAMRAQEELDSGLGIVHAELLPDEKARIIKSFKKQGTTVMVGDGINDAPALATADIGISMGISGSALATETGQVILMTNDLRKLPKLIKLARKANRTIIENVILSMTTKGAILALAIAGHPLVWAAVLADVGTCLVVIMNSMLLLKGSGNHARKVCLRSYDDKKSSIFSSVKHKNCCPGDEFRASATSCCLKSTESKCLPSNVLHHHAIMCCKSSTESHCPGGYQMISTEEDLTISAKGDCCAQRLNSLANQPTCCRGKNTQAQATEQDCSDQRCNNQVASDQPKCCRGKSSQAQATNQDCCDQRSNLQFSRDPKCCNSKGTQIQTTNQDCCGQRSSLQVACDQPKRCKPTSVECCDQRSNRQVTSDQTKCCEETSQECCDQRSNLQVTSDQTKCCKETSQDGCDQRSNLQVTSDQTRCCKATSQDCCDQWSNLPVTSDQTKCCKATSQESCQQRSCLQASSDQPKCCRVKSTHGQVIKQDCCDQQFNIQVTTDNSKCCKSGSTQAKTSEGSLPGVLPYTSGTKDACLGLEGPAIRSCCRNDYAKQCCSHSGHMSNCGFVGELTEIVIE